MRQLLSIWLIMIALSVTAGCTNNQVGTAGGAVLGGVAGSALTHGSAAGTIAGAAGGALIGNAVVH
jgi:osmotically inducible lipoprotein OsmB